MSEAEQQAYKDKAAAAKAAAEEAAAAAAAEGGEEGAAEQGGEGQEGHQQGQGQAVGMTRLPLSVVKRVVMCDPEAARISHDALLVVTAGGCRVTWLLS